MNPNFWNIVGLMVVMTMKYILLATGALAWLIIGIAVAFMVYGELRGFLRKTQDLE